MWYRSHEMKPRHRFALGLIILVLGGAFVLLRYDETQSRPVPVQPVTQAAVTPTPAVIVRPAAPKPTSLPVLPSVITQGIQTRILMYHYVRIVDAKKDPLGYRLSITPAEFEAQLKLLQNQGYQGLTMSQVAEGRGGPKTVALTFDDGYEDFYTTAWPLLKQYGFTATTYIISGKIGGDYMTWDQIRELNAAGIEIGAHTVNHIDLAKATPIVQQHEILDSKTTIENNIGVKVGAFCYPSGKYTALTEQIVAADGLKTATTTNPGIVHRGDDPFALHRQRVNPGLTEKEYLDLVK